MFSTFRAAPRVALAFVLTCAPALSQVLPPDIGTTIREIEQRRPEVPEQVRPSLQVEQPTRPALQAAPDARFSCARSCGNSRAAK